MTTLFNKIKEVTELKAAAGFETPVRDYLRRRGANRWSWWYFRYQA